MAGSTKITLYLNEHFSDDIAVALRAQGYDVVSAHGAGMDQKSDEEQLAHAVSEGRALLTSNFGDFDRLDDEYRASGREHFGIIFTRDNIPWRVILQLTQFLEKATPDEVHHQIRWLKDWL